MSLKLRMVLPLFKSPQNRLTCLLCILGVFALLLVWNIFLLALLSGVALQATVVLQLASRSFSRTLDM